MKKFNLKKNKTIYKDLIFWLSSIITIVVVILSIIMYSYYTFTYKQILYEQANQTTDKIKKVIVSPLWRYDIAFLKDITNAYLSSDFIIGIKIKTKNEVLIENIPKDRDYILISKDVKFYANGKDLYLGTLDVYYSLKNIKNTQQTIIYTILLISFFILFGTILGSRFILKLILEKKLLWLIDGIKKIASGDYNKPLPNVAQKELNEVIIETNLMAKHISKREKQLKKTKNELKESEKQYREIFNNSVEGLFQCKVGGKLCNANNAMSKILGYNSSDELIKKITDFRKQLFVHSTIGINFFKLLEENEIVINNDYQFYRKDKSKVWITLQAYVKKNKKGKITCIEGSISDISERKKAESFLKNANLELEKRVEERTKELQKTNESLERAKEDAVTAKIAKDEFLANMSHEIRTPMNGVLGAANLALEEDLPEKVIKYLEIISSSGKSLLTIINEILDFSKIEAGKLTLEKAPFDLEDILNNISNVFLSKISEKDIELVFDAGIHIPKYFIGDALRIQQIFVNLIGNAVKFTGMGGVICLGADVLRNYEDCAILKFYVKDTGIGMTEKQAKTVFNPFSQAEKATTRKYGGTGLGLSITKNLVELMGGEIWLNSSLGKGTTFYFTLKIYKDLNKKETKYIIPKDIKSLDVLIIDDCEDTLTILKNVYESFGFNAETVMSGIEAIEILSKKKKKYDLISLDWIMPTIDGIETVKKIRENLKITTPVIMATAYGKELNEKLAQKSGVNTFLSKPINASNLFNAIMEIFGKDGFVKTTKTKKEVNYALKYKNTLEGLEVLLVEDNITNQQIAKAILEKAGIIVDIANNGKESLDAVEEKDYHLILMDIQMPEMDGFQATQIIRENKKHNLTPIIAMTAHAMKKDEEKCLEAGMNNFITKPINQHDLFDTIYKVLEDFNVITKIKKQKEISEDKEEVVENYNLEGINVKDALSELEMKWIKFKEILKRFYTIHKDLLTEINKSYSSKNWHELEMLAHKLRGSSGNIRAYELEESTMQLEFACKNIKNNKINKVIIESVSLNFEKVMNSISKLFDKDKDKSKHLKISKDELLKTFSKLKVAINDSNQLKIKQLLKKIISNMEEPIVSNLEADITKYEYNSALKKIDYICEKYLEED